MENRIERQWTWETGYIYIYIYIYTCTKCVAGTRASNKLGAAFRKSHGESYSVLMSKFGPPCVWKPPYGFLKIGAHLEAIGIQGDFRCSKPSCPPNSKHTLRETDYLRMILHVRGLGDVNTWGGFGIDHPISS